MRTLSALEKVEEGSYEHRDLALPSYRWGWAEKDVPGGLTLKFSSCSKLLCCLKSELLPRS